MTFQNQEKQKEYMKNYYIKNRHRLLKQKHQYYLENTQHTLIMKKNYRNSEKGKQIIKNYQNTEKGKQVNKKAYKKWRKSKKGKQTIIRLKKKHYKQIKVRSILKYPIQKGWLTRDVCAICGNDNQIKIHHEDYDYPFHIMWLCSKHHSMATNNQRL